MQAIPGGLPEDVPDSLAAWATRYLALAVVGVRSEEVTKKIALHLDRFIAFFIESYGHDRISTCLRRDVLAWQQQLVKDGLAPATVNNHLASLSAFTNLVIKGLTSSSNIRGRKRSLLWQLDGVSGHEMCRVTTHAL